MLLLTSLSLKKVAAPVEKAVPEGLSPMMTGPASMSIPRIGEWSSHSFFALSTHVFTVDAYSPLLGAAYLLQCNNSNKHVWHVNKLSEI